MHLLDGNVLVALVVEDHVHHTAASTWLRTAGTFATCPITQGTLLRVLIQGGMNSTRASEVLGRLTAHGRHEFWPDNLDYGEVELGSVIGHRQVTDAYLAQLARSRSARFATLDRGVAQLHDDVADLLPPHA